MAVLTILILSLIVLLEAETSQGQKNDCQQFDKVNYCENNSRLLVTKTKKDYIVKLCSGGQCMTDIPGDANLRIKCKDVCDVCKSLPGQNDCSGHAKCEEQVDKFFNDYCISGNQSQTQPIELIVGASATATGVPKVSGQFSPSVQSKTTASSLNGGVTALAILFSLCVVLLAVVTAGWVWTCLATKRGERANKEKEDDVEEGEEIYFKNPTYEGNSNQNGVRPVSYDTVEHALKTIEEDDGNTYAVPDKNWETKGTYIF